MAEVLAFLASPIGKIVIGLVMPIIVGLLKSAFGAAWQKVPEVLRPIVTALLGALAGAATGGDPTTGAVIGAGAGAAGKAVRDMYRAFNPADPFNLASKGD